MRRTQRAVQILRAFRQRWRDSRVLLMARKQRVDRVLAQRMRPVEWRVHGPVSIAASPVVGRCLPLPRAGGFGLRLSAALAPRFAYLAC